MPCGAVGDCLGEGTEVCTGEGAIRGVGVGLGVASVNGGGAMDDCGVMDGDAGPSGEAEKFRNATMIPATTATTAITMMSLFMLYCETAAVETPA